MKMNINDLTACRSAGSIMLVTLLHLLFSRIAYLRLYKKNFVALLLLGHIAADHIVTVVAWSGSVSVCASVCWSRPGAVLKLLNRSRCNLGCGQVGTKLTMGAVGRGILGFRFGRASCRTCLRSIISTTPLVRTSFGARSFRVAAPKIWNSLPPSLRTCTSPDTSRRHLKTHYCQQAF